MSGWDDTSWGRYAAAQKAGVALSDVTVIPRDGRATVAKAATGWQNIFNGVNPMLSSVNRSPQKLMREAADWARRAVQAYRDFGADRIVAEANNGGDLVLTVIRTIDPHVPVTLVHASRGKRTRAEPVAALYEQGRWFHVEPFPALEDQMCSYTGAPGEDSPDRMDAHVWGASSLMDIQPTSNSWGGGGTWGQAA